MADYEATTSPIDEAYVNMTTDFSTTPLDELIPPRQAYYDPAQPQDVGAQALAPATRTITNMQGEADLARSSGQEVVWLSSPGQQPAQPVVAPKGLLPEVGDMFSSIQDFNSQIEKATTYEDKQRLLLDMRQSAISKIEDAQKVAIDKAENLLGVPKMRQVFEQASLIAQTNPKYAQELQQLGNQLNMLETRAQSTASRAMKEDPRLQGFIKSVDSSIQHQTKMADVLYSEQRRKLEKQETAREAAGDILQGIQPGAIDTLVGILPNLKKADGTIDSVATAKVIQSNKDWRPLLNGTIPPTKFMSEALQGSDAARVMTIAEESKRTGKTPQEVERQLSEAQTLLNNPNLLEQELIKYKISKPLTEAEASAKSKELLASGGKKKSHEEALREYQGNIGKVEKLFAAKNEERLQNIKSWPLEVSPLNDPAAAQVFNELTKVRGKEPGILDFTKAFVNAPGISKEEKEARQQSILDGYGEAAKRTQSSILHVPLSPGDIDNAKRKLKVSMVLDKTFSEKAGAFLGGKYDPRPAMLEAMKGPRDAAQVYGTGQPDVDPVGNFFKGLIGEQ